MPILTGAKYFDVTLALNGASEIVSNHAKGVKPFPQKECYKLWVQLFSY